MAKAKSVKAKATKTAKVPKAKATQEAKAAVPTTSTVRRPW